MATTVHTGPGPRPETFTVDPALVAKADALTEQINSRLGGSVDVWSVVPERSWENADWRTDSELHAIWMHVGEGGAIKVDIRDPDPLRTLMKTLGHDIAVRIAAGRQLGKLAGRSGNRYQQELERYHRYPGRYEVHIVETDELAGKESVFAGAYLICKAWAGGFNEREAEKAVGYAAVVIASPALGKGGVA